MTAAQPKGGATTESKDEPGVLKITKDMKPGEIAKRFARSAVELVNR